DTKTPLTVSVFAIVLDVLLMYLLARPTSYGIAGLALAQSFVAVFEVVILTTIMFIRDHRLLDRDFFGACARIVSVGGFSLTAGYIMITFYPLGLHDRGFIT